MHKQYGMQNQISSAKICEFMSHSPNEFWKKKTKGKVLQQINTRQRKKKLPLEELIFIYKHN